jgi:ribosomal protein S18 acetylase RimI-like enzyme
MAVVCRGTDEGDARVAIVSSVYVNAGDRRQGVARGLLSAIIDHLTAYPEIATIRLWVSPSQHAARELYETMGFGVVALPDRDDAAARGDDRLILERPASRHEPR